MGMLGNGWRGGSVRGAVSGYVTRQGKRVKSYTRRSAKRVSRNAAAAVAGKAALQVMVSPMTWRYKIGTLLILALGGNPPSAKTKKRGR